MDCARSDGSIFVGHFVKFQHSEPKCIYKMGRRGYRTDCGDFIFYLIDLLPTILLINAITYPLFFPLSTGHSV